MHGRKGAFCTAEEKTVRGKVRKGEREKSFSRHSVVVCVRANRREVTAAVGLGIAMAEDSAAKRTKFAGKKFFF